MDPIRKLLLFCWVLLAIEGKFQILLSHFLETHMNKYTTDQNTHTL